jgi:hypothetical protein
MIERFGVKLNIKTNATFEHGKFVVDEVINWSILVDFGRILENEMYCLWYVC